MQAKVFSNVVIKANETTVTLPVEGEHSRKALRRRCKQFKTDHGINGYVLAVTADDYVVTSVR